MVDIEKGPMPVPSNPSAWAVDQITFAHSLRSIGTCAPRMLKSLAKRCPSERLMLSCTSSRKVAKDMAAKHHLFVSAARAKYKTRFYLVYLFIYPWLVYIVI